MTASRMQPKRQEVETARVWPKKRTMLVMPLLRWLRARQKLPMALSQEIRRHSRLGKIRFMGEGFVLTRTNEVVGRLSSMYFDCVCFVTVLFTIRIETSIDI